MSSGRTSAVSTCVRPNARVPASLPVRLRRGCRDDARRGARGPQPPQENREAFRRQWRNVQMNLQPAIAIRPRVCLRTYKLSEDDRIVVFRVEPTRLRCGAVA